MASRCSLLRGECRKYLSVARLAPKESSDEATFTSRTVVLGKVKEPVSL